MSDLIKLELDGSVNRLAMQTVNLIDQLKVPELLKLESQVAASKKIRANAAGVKTCLMMIGFAYVEAVKQASNEQRQKNKPLPGQQSLL